MVSEAVFWTLYMNKSLQVKNVMRASNVKVTVTTAVKVKLSFAVEGTGPLCYVQIN